MSKMKTTYGQAIEWHGDRKSYEKYINDIKCWNGYDPQGAKIGLPVTMGGSGGGTGCQNRTVPGYLHSEIEERNCRTGMGNYFDVSSNFPYKYHHRLKVTEPTIGRLMSRYSEDRVPLTEEKISKICDVLLHIKSIKKIKVEGKPFMQYGQMKTPIHDYIHLTVEKEGKTLYIRALDKTSWNLKTEYSVDDKDWNTTGQRSPLYYAVDLLALRYTYSSVNSGGFQNVDHRHHNSIDEPLDINKWLLWFKNELGVKLNESQKRYLPIYKGSLLRDMK